MDIKKRNPKIPVPDEKKDEKYWKYRKRNTITAREYRIKAKKLKAEKEIYLEKLLLKNKELKKKVEYLTKLLENVKKITFKEDVQIQKNEISEQDLFENLDIDYELLNNLNQYYF